MGVDGDVLVEVVQNPDADNDNNVSGDHKGGEPDWNVPALAPGYEGQEDDAGEQQGFVGEGVHEGTKSRSLVEVSCDVAVDTVAERGEDEYTDGPPADGLVGGSGLDAFSIVYGEYCEDGGAEQTAEGDFGSEGHCQHALIRGQ